MTQALFVETAKAEEETKAEGIRRLNVSGVLRILGVSRNGYYGFRKGRLSSQKIKKGERIDEIRKIHNESHQNYGAPKITKILQGKGDSISERTVGKYMREIGIRARYVKHYTRTTIDPNFSSELKNILNRKFNPKHPNGVWCSDITYIWTYEGFVYLTSIMDLFSRKIIAWVLSDTLEAKWVVDAIEQAKRKRKVDRPLVIQSDRGIQYTCSAYHEVTEGFHKSYSMKASPWDNACIESFHALLKREWINRFRIYDYNHAYRLVFEYIETFYNTYRIHSHCGYLSLNDFEEQYQKKLVEMERCIRKAS